jgi:hypothetical protein
MTVLTDADLYLRGAATLLASWGEYVRGATGAAAQHSPAVPTAVSPNEREGAVGHTALLERDLAPNDAAAKSSDRGVVSERSRVPADGCWRMSPSGLPAHSRRWSAGTPVARSAATTRRAAASAEKSCKVRSWRSCPFREPSRLVR